MAKALKFLLVCEGPTDIAFLKTLTENLGAEFDATIELSELSPQRDATTRAWPRHGWSEVRSWCKFWKVKTPAEINAIDAMDSPFAVIKKRNWKALVEAGKADGLIIQMDTDIAEEIVDFNCLFSDYTGNRRDFCQEAIHFWLGETPETIDGVYLLLPSYAMETWLLASHEPSEDVFNDLTKPFNYEDLSDYEDRLIALEYSSKNINGRRRLKKLPHKYINYANRVFPKLADVKTRCPEAERFYSNLENHV